MNIFAMVTTQHSNIFTNYALSSLIQCTRFAPDDDVVVIDNDGEYGELPVECRQSARLLVNDKPKSFAANVNQILIAARDRKADVIFTNNDVVFSPGWFEPLRLREPCLLSPVTNAELQYSGGGFECKKFMDLEDYLGKEQLFLALARQHRNKAEGYVKVLSFPFVAVKIPFEIYSSVGLLDETFGLGGGEDKDYCIRCYEQGFELRFAVKSFILHFQGKSTWRGAETAERMEARNQMYIERFKKKWGQALFEVTVMHDPEHLPPDLKQAYDQLEFRKLVESLRPRMGGNP